VQAALDLPAVGEPTDPLTIRIEGWVYGAQRHGEIEAIEAVANGTVKIGETSLLFPRDDVSAALRIAPGVATGFAILGAAPELVAAREVELALRIRFRDGVVTTVTSRKVSLTGRDYRRGDWGILIDPAFPHLVRREHMYNSGPSLEAPSERLVQLLRRYLPPTPAKLLDIGCGRGPYAAPLRNAGYDWFGVEVKPEDCEALAQKGLPHRRVDGQSLPFEPGAFDAAMCIEVLEHTVDPWSFIAEVRRVVSRRVVISVPNLEAVPYWRPHLAVPWHLLEADHKNFFSRASLRELLGKHFRTVDVLSYAEAPLRTVEGATVDYHLLAVATV
jgi:SAM-dependent methyltransferase